VIRRVDYLSASDREVRPDNEADTREPTTAERAAQVEGRDDTEDQRLKTSAARAGLCDARSSGSTRVAAGHLKSNSKKTWPA